MTHSRRVVVTGLGAITPLGLDVPSTWNALIEGRSGVGKVSSFPIDGFACQIAAEVKNFSYEPLLDKAHARRLARFSQFSIVATHQALQDSGIEFSDADRHRSGVLLGVGIGGLEHIEAATLTLKERGVRRVSPFTVPLMIPNIAAGHVSIHFGLKGPNSCTTTACAAGAHAIGDATNLIRQGLADVMVAGGAESAITPVSLASFAACKALSIRNDDPTRASRPFDRNRDGFVMGEGAGILILEEYERAKKRGAKIYTEVVGYGLNSDAYHMTNPRPDGSGAGTCIKLCLQDAQISPEKIGYINAHGTSTSVGDVAETRAIKLVWGSSASKVFISSTKSMTGHLLGGAGGVEAVFSILSLVHNVLPPTINLENPDSECDLNYIPNAAVEKKVYYTLSNSFGFGGTNASLIFKKV